MRIGTRHLAAATIDWLKAAVKADGSTRSSLARGLCEREDWRNPKGALCLASARAALPGLASALDLTLPAPRPHALNTGTVERDYPDKPLACALEDLGEVTVEPVADGADKRRARSMMATWHPEGEARCPGARVSYWITSSVHGRLGGLVFSAAGWHQKARDRFIGWSQGARDAHLGEVVNNDRFLVLPSVTVKGLASHALALACARLATDWHAKYGTTPVLAYTYVGPGHAGTSYRAAGWQRCAEATSGTPPGADGPGPQRSVWMKPLAPDWRQVLCREPERVMGQAQPLAGDGETDWARREYGRSGHSDARIRERIVTMGRAWNDRPGEVLPVIFPGEAEQRAAWRLLSNPKVTMDHILEGHQEAMVERCRPQRLILAVQDTTFLDYNGLEATEDLVDIGGGGSGTLGMAAHAGVAFTEGGCALGLFHLDAGFRVPPGLEPDDRESRRWLDGYDRAAELAAACPATRVLVICDREGDAWDLLEKGASHEVGLLVRASRSTRRRVVTATGPRELWEHMADEPCLAVKRIDIAACGGPRRRQARKGVRLEVRAAMVDLVPPGRKPRATPPLSMMAVHVTEPAPPADREPLDWMLLTSEGDACAADALKTVSFYERRWLIEEYFRALKVGTRIEDRRLDQADDLRKCLAFDAITACRVMTVERLARSEPETPASRVVHRDEITVLNIYKAGRQRKQRAPPDSEPTIEAFAIEVARIAGFIPRKRQPLPGTEKLWQGYKILLTFVENYRMMRELDMLKQPESRVSG